MPPGRGDVAVEAVRLVLRQHDDLEVAGVDDVRQREVDQAVDPAERHRGFGPVGRQRHQSLALAAGEDDCEDLLARGRDGHATKLAARRGAVDHPWALGSAHAHRRPQQGVPARRSTEVPACTSPSSSARCACCPTSTPGCAASARRDRSPARRRTPSRRRSPAPTPPSARSASTSRWSTTATGPTWCTPTPGTPTWPATSPGCCTASPTSSAPTRWSRCGRGRPSSSAAATPCRAGRSARRTRVPPASSR